MNRMNTFVGEYTTLTPLNYGPLMFVDTRDPVNLTIAIAGIWEDWIGKVFMSYVKPGMTVLDIGAHSGYFSVLAGMLTGPTGAVHSFEPNPFHHKNFIKTMSFNGYNHVRLHKVLLSNTRGETEITTAGEGGTSIYFVGMQHENEPTRFKVAMGPITDYLPVPRADIVKIDVDGFEPYIMDSLFEVIQNSHSMSVFMEYLPMLWKDTDPLTILNRFAQARFRFYWLQRDYQVVEVTVQQLAAYKGNEQLDLVMVRQ